MPNYKFSCSEIEILKQRWNKFAQGRNGNFRSVKVETSNSFEHTLLRFEMNIPYLDKDISFALFVLNILKA